MDKVIANNQIGYLVMKDDGAVLESSGDLKNDERSANVIMGLLQLTESIDENFMPNNSCERISIDYEHYWYNICMSNRRIYVVKLSKTDPNASSNASTSTNVSSNTTATTSAYNTEAETTSDVGLGSTSTVLA